MAFEGTLQDFTVNMHGPELEHTCIEVQQGDTASRRVRIHLKDFGGADFKIPYGATAVFCINKSDGHKVYDACEIEDESTVIVTLSNQAIACAGRQKAQVYITKDGWDIKTQVFTVNAPRAIYTDDAIKSSDEFGILSELIADYEAIVDSAGKSAVSAADSAAAAEAARQAAEQLKQDIEESLGQISENKDNITELKSDLANLQEGACDVLLVWNKGKYVHYQTGALQNNDSCATTDLFDGDNITLLNWNGVISGFSEFKVCQIKYSATGEMISGRDVYYSNYSSQYKSIASMPKFEKGYKYRLALATVAWDNLTQITDEQCNTVIELIKIYPIKSVEELKASVENIEHEVEKEKNILDELSQGSKKTENIIDVTNYEWNGTLSVSVDNGSVVINGTNSSNYPNLKYNLPTENGHKYLFAVDVKENSNINQSFNLVCRVAGDNATSQTKIKDVSNVVGSTESVIDFKRLAIIGNANGSSLDFCVSFSLSESEKSCDVSLRNFVVCDVTDLSIPQIIKLINKGYFAEMIVEPYTADILFWGDSLTAGAGGNGVKYPSVCSEILGATHLNCGVGGETANTISARQGGNSLIIPAGNVNGTYGADELVDIYGKPIHVLCQGTGSESVNPIVINGQKCQISAEVVDYKAQSYTISGYDGSPTATPSFARMSGNDFNAKITVIFVGENGPHIDETTGIPTDIEQRMSIIDSMVNKLGNANYIVLGLCTRTEEIRAEEDKKMLYRYGVHFYPTRTMLCKYGLAIENLTATTEDIAAINEGRIPPQLMSDNTHLNEKGYHALGVLLAQKIVSLGYDKLIN